MIPKSVIKEFQSLIGHENVMAEEADRMSYAYDAATLPPVLPELVIKPLTSEQLGKAIRLCNENKIPVTVRGSGTNLSGGTVPKQDGCVILTLGLSKILEINKEDMYAVVQPGVITAQFAAAVEGEGLFYPPDPASMAVSTIGGNVSENSGGLRGLKYGVTKDYVLGIDFFDAEGNLIKNGSRTVKCVTGMNLAGIMVGSEGTLGVFNEIVLKLIPPPASRKAMIAVFDSQAAASETVSLIIASKIIPCTLEFIDKFTIGAIEEFSHAGLPTDAQALLLIEVDGHPAQVEEEAAKVESICRNMGATNVRVAKDSLEREKVWAARRAALSALARLKPTTVLEDATVPRSKIPAMVKAIGEIQKKYGLMIGVFGHAGDGNLHPTILTDKRDINEWKNIEKATEEIFDAALSLNGTLSGEHGIGIAKSRFLVKEIGQASINFSKKIKSAIDPNNILNPGKITGI